MRMKKILSSTALALAVALTLALPAGLALAASVVVGNPAIARANLDTYSNFTIIDTNHPVSASGSLGVFQYYAANTNSFEFVLVNASNVVEWVSPTITPTVTGAQTYLYPATVSVQAGWNLGVHFDSTGTIPFDYTGAPAAYTPNNTGRPTVGSTLSIEGTSDRMYSWNAGALPQYTVTIDKFVNGSRATVSNAHHQSFQMVSLWDAANLGSGSGSYALGPTGYNSPNAYEAITSPMDEWAHYTTHEVMNGSSVATSCAPGVQYRLKGYTTGTTLITAAAATPSLTVPDFTSLLQNEYVIVWNETCAPPVTVTVHNEDVGFVHDTSSAFSGTGGNTVGSFGGNAGSAWGGSSANGGAGGVSSGSITTGPATSFTSTFNSVNLNFLHVHW